MLKKFVISTIASFGLLLGVSSGGTVAQINHEMQAENSQTTEFHHLEQPLWVKGTVTASTLALVGLELWWFLWSKPKIQKVQTIAQKSYSRK
ncbi:MAG: hypothetical protein KME33_17820 [Aetokthonos hydrillicola CCALA 1050]|nr:hypothetical protein [Aetokthonos hydrillicola CCALA 1050]